MSVDELRCVNAIRVLAAEVVEKANSGHPGAPMGMAPFAHVLFSRGLMKYNPMEPKWANRDRFILSNGHACALLYSMLYLTGYDLTLDDLKKFRQLDAVCAGHPENILHPAIEVSTGPLGQGISNAVGMAMGEAHMAATYNKEGFSPVIDSYTYVFCGDGCLQEGVSAEASSLAGHLGLGKLIVLYDDNHITIDGETDLSFTEDVLKRYEAYGWHTQHVANGDKDLDGIENAIRAAQAVKDRPSMIKVTTTIGFGSKKQGKEDVHGAPLGKDDLKNVKALFGFDPEASFAVPEDVLAYYREAGNKASSSFPAWKSNLDAYAAKYPAEAADFARRMENKLPEGWMDKLPRYKGSDKADATRNLSGVVINNLAGVLPELIGGSADLTPSNKTHIKGAADFQKETPEGRYIRFGVREHAMAAICNGLAAYGGYIPYSGTFLNFFGYAAGGVRLSALSHFRVIYVATHDSIGLGEDGPTHQPVETLEHFRATPNMYVYRPADGNETSAAYASALLNTRAPAIIALSRQNLPHLETSSIEVAMMGGYTCFDAGAKDKRPDLVVAATGSEVSIAIEGAKKLVASDPTVRVQVASFPCLELFEQQEESYRRSVLPDGAPVLTVEASAVKGWERYGHAHIGMTTFGFSGPYLEVYKKVGITADNVCEKGSKMIAHFAGKDAPLVYINAIKF